MNRKGSVLIHVLVTGVIVAIIATGVLRMTLMNYIATARATTGQQNLKESDALLSRAITYWNQNNTVCSNIPGLNCSPPSGTPPGNCNCYCPSSSALPRIEAQLVGGRCQLSIVSSDPP